MQRPYQGETRKEIRDEVIAKQVTIKKSEIPIGWSLESADFINNVNITYVIKQCLQRNPASRLGVNGPSEIKRHYWFQDFEWKELVEKKIRPPFRPKENSDNFDHNNLANDAESLEEAKLFSNIIKKVEVQNNFSNYYFDSDNTIKPKENKIENRKKLNSQEENE